MEDGFAEAYSGFERAAQMHGWDIVELLSGRHDEALRRHLSEVAAMQRMYAGMERIAQTLTQHDPWFVEFLSGREEALRVLNEQFMKKPPPMTTLKEFHGAIDTLMAECSICMSQHSFREGITTSCGHVFGRTCYESYDLSNKEAHKKTTCPNCRCEAPSVTVYEEL